MDTFFATDIPESIIKSYSIRVKELGGVNLGQGIPSFSTAPHIIAAAKTALDEPNIGVYPNFLGTIELREAIIKKLNGNRNEIPRQARDDMKVENIIITVGAMEGFASTVFSLINNGDIVGVVTPDYCNHFPAIMLARGVIREIAMKEEAVWKLDVSEVEHAAKEGMKLLVITNPNNPTGAVYDRTQIEQLVSLSNQYGFWILSDETYAFLDYENKFTSLLDVWDQSERLIVVRSFSKEYAMTGWRVGYVITQPAFIKLIAKTHDAVVGCVPKISQEAALAAVTGTQDNVAMYKQTLAKRRQIVCHLLDGMSEYISYAKPEGAYYIFPKVTASLNMTNSMDLCKKILEEAQVATIPGSVFGKAGEHHLRISFAVDDSVLEQGVKKIQAYFASPSRSR